MKTLEATILFAAFAVGVGTLYAALFGTMGGVELPELWAACALALIVALVVWCLNGGKLLYIGQEGTDQWEGSLIAVVAGVLLLLIVTGMAIRIFVPAHDYWLHIQFDLGSARSLGMFLLTIPAWALAEEIVFRNIQSRLVLDVGRFSGIVTVALMFALYHLAWSGVVAPRHVADVLGALGGGVAFAVLFEVKPSIAFTWIAHSLYNVIATLDVLAHVRGIVLPEILVTASLALGAIIVILLCRGAQTREFWVWLLHPLPSKHPSRVVATIAPILIGVVVPLVVVKLRGMI